MLAVRRECLLRVRTGHPRRRARMSDRTPESGRSFSRVGTTEFRQQRTSRDENARPTGRTFNLRSPETYCSV